MSITKKDIKQIYSTIGKPGTLPNPIRKWLFDSIETITPKILETNTRISFFYDHEDYTLFLSVLHSENLGVDNWDYCYEINLSVVDKKKFLVGSIVMFLENVENELLLGQTLATDIFKIRYGDRVINGRLEYCVEMNDNWFV